MDNDADILTDVRGHDALLLNGVEKIPVKLELDDEGWPEKYSGALNVSDIKGNLIEVYHFSCVGLGIMSSMLDVSMAPAQGAVTANIVRDGRITDELVSMHLMRTRDGAVICREGGNKFSLGADPSRCLGNECNQLAYMGRIEG